MVERQPSKLDIRVRFSLPAPWVSLIPATLWLVVIMGIARYSIVVTAATMYGKSPPK